ncbi:hypothetical protein BSLA_01f2081 [Burkholderia stabilis]|nr:hypothetical protein BSLA_01f2081 [Burkholderia stabilis]
MGVRRVHVVLVSIEGLGQAAFACADVSSLRWGSGRRIVGCLPDRPVAVSPFRLYRKPEHLSGGRFAFFRIACRSRRKTPDSWRSE